MKVNEILVEFQPRTTKADVAKMKNINANVQQAMANGDADAGFEAGAELGDMLMNKVYPDMLQVITKMVNELEIACRKYAKDPRWAKACKELPKIKAELKAQRMTTYGQGQGRQDVGEGRLKSKKYKKSYKAAKSSGRRKKKKLRDDVSETATGMGAASVATVSANVGPMVKRNMYNADGTMKNGIDYGNLLGGKKKTKKKQKAA
jgi:hypothetical protein